MLPSIRNSKGEAGVQVVVWVYAKINRSVWFGRNVIVETSRIWRSIVFGLGKVSNITGGEQVLKNGES